MSTNKKRIHIKHNKQWNIINNAETEHMLDTSDHISDAYLEPECDRRPCLPSLVDEWSISIDES